MRQLGLVEHLHREIEWKGGHDLRRRLGRQVAQGLGHVRRPHPDQRVGEIARVVVQQIKQLGHGRRTVR
jgi:hypothetical protein